MSTKKVTKTMLNSMAKELGIKGAAKLAKEDLIHAIQVAEGNVACFKRIPDCTVTPCLYRGECMGE